MGFLLGPLKWLVQVCLGYIVDYISNAWHNYQIKKQEEAIAKENERRFQEALKTGDRDAIEQAGADLLNGRKH